MYICLFITWQVSYFTTETPHNGRVPIFILVIYQRIIVWLQTHLMYKNYVNKSKFVKYVVLFYMLCVYVTTIVNTQCFYIQINEYVFLC